MTEMIALAGVATLPASPMRYFIHPESASAWSQADDAPDDFLAEGLVMEVSQEEFLRACAAYGENAEPEDPC